jgi:GT2 family glycosyltransferase
MGQKIALDKKVPLILIESDVIIAENTITDLTETATHCKNPGLVGLATVDQDGNFNFPYSYIKNDQKTVIETPRSLSFCCTLISYPFLKKYNFDQLPQKKDWFDIYISGQSRKHGFHNYLIKKNGVLHLPHSSRPWKQLKYSHPFRYYFYKLLQRRDRI